MTFWANPRGHHRIFRLKPTTTAFDSENGDSSRLVFMRVVSREMAMRFKSFHADRHSCLLLECGKNKFLAADRGQVAYQMKKWRFR